MGVVCSWFPGLGLASASFGAKLSWVRMGDDDEEEGAKRLFPAEVRWDSSGGMEERWSSEQYDAEIVCFEGNGPGSTKFGDCRV
jgi:hypothetical protein